MLVGFTSLTDEGLPLLLSDPGVAVVVPAHLSRPGWWLDERGDACLVTSRGALKTEQVSGVLVRIERIQPTEIPHVDPRDREYVAVEMTAFLAALITSLRCPVFNSPTAGCLAGPAWNWQHWCRAADREGVKICDRSRKCAVGSSVVVLDGKPLLDSSASENFVRTAGLLAAIAGVRLVQVDVCQRHGNALQPSLIPRLSSALLERIQAAVLAELPP